MVIDLSFTILAALLLSIPIVRVKMWRNLFFIPILLFISVLNGIMYLAMLGDISISFITVSHIMVLLVTVVMCIMGGRVFPMFTANGTETKRVPPLLWLERLSLISVALCLLVAANLLSFSAALEGGLLILAGISNFIRALRWRIWVTFKVPLLWSLHLSYWSICCGLIMLGLEKLGLFNYQSLAYHTITVGGIGLMILSMISRVSLGHTGRLIKVGTLVSFTFLCIAMALLTRVWITLIFSHYMVFILLSSALWVLAYTVFVITYFPILFKPRIDGRAG